MDVTRGVRMAEGEDRLALNRLAEMRDFRFGPIMVSPSLRRITGPGGERPLQPLMMLLLLALTRRAGQVVTRASLFDLCWGDSAVGDDSLNRAVHGVRQAIEAVAGGGVTLQTVPRAGYRLTGGVVTSSGEAAEPADAAEAALDAWKLGLPRPDMAVIETLDAALRAGAGGAREWGILALALRKAVEYAEPSACAGLVARCERAAQRALSMDANEEHARVALSGLPPLFGNWARAGAALTRIVDDHPDGLAGRHELAVQRMATGQVRAAAALIESLIDAMPFAATLHYKRAYQQWTLGDAHAALRTAESALALWPRHVAIWNARYWILLSTGRAEQAARVARSEEEAPPMPEDARAFLAETARVIGGRGVTQDERQALVNVAIDRAARGPVQAVSAMQALSVLGEVDAAFAVADAYYVGAGARSTPLHWNPRDPSITDQHRRLTQALFVPTCAGMRADPRFDALCARIGLGAYWETAGVVPDYRRGD